MRRRTVAEWRSLVYAATGISHAVKVYLLLLSDYMRPDRKVSVPRKQIAKELRCHEQRVGERHAAAIEAGFLTVVEPGYRGHTAVYQGLFPDKTTLESVPINRTHTKRPENRYAYQAQKRTDPQDTTSKQLPNRQAVGYLHNEKRQGRTDEPEARL